MYGNQTTYTPTLAGANVLLQRVCFLLASGLVVTGMSSWVFQDAVGLMMPFMIATFVLLFLLQAVRYRPGVNVLVFYLFCLAEGGMLGPLLQMYARTFGSGIIAQAFLLTSIAVAGIGGYAYTSGKDFGFLGRTLYWILFGVILVGLASFFMTSLQTTAIHMGYELVVLGLFVGFLLYDFSNIRRRYSPEQYTVAAVHVYLDFLNMFLAILNILGMLQGGGGRRR